MSIPKIIFQRHSDPIITLQNPDFSYYYFDTDAAINLISSNFTIDVLNLFKNTLSYDTKFELWKLCSLYVYGGIYIENGYNISGAFEPTDNLICPADSNLYQFKLIDLIENECFAKTDCNTINNLVFSCSAKNKMLHRAILNFTGHIKCNSKLNEFLTINSIDRTFTIIGFTPIRILHAQSKLKVKEAYENVQSFDVTQENPEICYYNGDKKTVIYLTDIPYTNSPKHGNQTRINSTLNYFYNNPDNYKLFILSNRSSYDKYKPNFIYSSNLNTDLKEYVDKLKPDIVFINYLTLINYTVMSYICDKCKVLIDMHDCKESNSIMYKQAYDNKYVTMKFDSLREVINSYKNLKSNLYLYKFHTLVHISYEEYCKYKNAFPDLNQIYIPFFEKPVIDKTIVYSAKKNIIFVASDNQFNIHAFKYFYRNTLPEIIRVIPYFKLSVYGVITNRFKENYKHPNIDYIGFVEKKEDIYNYASFAICPLIFGTGSKIKVYEALSYNVPIVSYEFSGCLELQHDKNGLIANNQDEFVQYVIDLYLDPELRTRLSSFDTNLNYDIIPDELSKII